MRAETDSVDGSGPAVSAAEGAALLLLLRVASVMKEEVAPCCAEKKVPVPERSALLILFKWARKMPEKNKEDFWLVGLLLSGDAGRSA